MANTFYVANISPIFAPSVLRGSWNTVVPPPFTFLLTDSKIGDNIIGVGIFEGSASNPNDVFVLRGVSERLSAQTISGTLNVVLGTLSSDAAARYFWHIHAYVTQGDTDLVRGTLINNYSEDISNYWTTIAQGRELVANVPITSTTIQNGDRIVIEAGYVARTLPGPDLTRGLTTGKVKVIGPVSSISLTFPTPPAVGSGVIVSILAQRAGGVVNLSSCVDNRGNAYSIALPLKYISGTPEYGIIVYYCQRVNSTGNPFTITVTATTSDCCFVGSATEVTGLAGGSLTVEAVASNTVSSPTTSITSGAISSLTGQLYTVGLFACTDTQPSITAQVLIPPWTQEYEELSTVWGQSITGEGDSRVINGVSSTTANWTTGSTTKYAAGIVAFKVVGAAILAAPGGAGTIYIGAQASGVPAANLTVSDTQVMTHAGSVNFSQNILVTPISPSLVGHVVVQIARPEPPVPALIGHIVTQIARIPAPATSAIGHVIIQVVPTVAALFPDLSGLYFLNPSKVFFHDSYYHNVELKIPDPTIKTALLGE